MNTKIIATFNRKYRSFAEARKFATSLKLNSSSEWIKHCKTKNIPQDIPKRPSAVYKNSGWRGFKHFLGLGVSYEDYLDYKDARDFIRKLKLKSAKEFQIYMKTEKRPNNISSRPSSFYKDNGWINWADFLGKE